MRILSIGELLWDVFPSAEHLGGAPFNFAANCARLGHDVVFLTAVGNDERGERALQGAREAGVASDFIQRTDAAPTGTVPITLDEHGQPDFTILRPAAYDYLRGDAETIGSIAKRSPELIYFGTLSELYANNRNVLQAIVESLPGSWRFYDVNLRRDCYTPDLLRDLLQLANVVKLNDQETAVIQRLFGTANRSIEGFCRAYSDHFGWHSVCITRAEAGCSILLNGEYVEVDGYPVATPHPVGAGDAFAAAFCHGLANGWDVRRIGDFANRVGALVASRPEAVSDWTLDDVYALNRQTTKATPHEVKG